MRGARLGCTGRSRWWRRGWLLGGAGGGIGIRAVFGPGTSTQVLELYLYNQGLTNSLPGLAAAVAVLLLAATLPLILLAIRRMDQEKPA